MGRQEHYSPPMGVIARLVNKAMSYAPPLGIAAIC